MFETWESNGNPDLAGRISGCGREHCANRITCYSSKRGHEKKQNVYHYSNSINNINLNNGARDSGLFSPWISSWRSGRGSGFSACGSGVLAGLTKQSNRWNQPVHLSHGMLENWESNGNADLDGRISGSGREYCTNRITCDSSKRGHQKKPNVNHCINSVNNINLNNGALASGLFSPWISSWHSGRGSGFAACWSGVYAGLTKQSNRWNQPAH